tara:strand:+ start:294 stop:479 length:186 start_codon:yes stop_codon:yes gene_type:complete
MFGLSLKWIISIVMVFVLTLTQLLTSTLPDIFLPRIMLPYQAWIVALWLFIFLLPVKVTPF